MIKFTVDCANTSCRFIITSQFDNVNYFPTVYDKNGSVIETDKKLATINYKCLNCNRDFSENRFIDIGGKLI